MKEALKRATKTRAANGAAGLVQRAETIELYRSLVWRTRVRTYIRLAGVLEDFSGTTGAAAL